MARIFTLEEARALLPEVKRLTGPVFELAASLAEEMQEAEDRGQEESAESLRDRMATLMDSWAGAVKSLGPDVKGLWLVDFDSGDGYWCWAYPEEELNHWHGYHDGFSGRVPLDLKSEPRQWP
jgi:hypothetical protein